MPLALVTGASSGLGRALAVELAARGFDLALTGRDGKGLEGTAARCRAHGREAAAFAQDLAAPGGAAALCERLHERGLSPEVLVNNAGFGVHGPFLETPLEDELRLASLGIGCVLELTKRLVPEMRRRGRGRVLNVGSVYSFSPVPYQAVYAASKAFLLSFSASLAEELRGTGVTVTALCPGITRTEFRKRAGMPDKGPLKGMSAEAVARAGCDGLLRGTALVVPGTTNKLFVALARFAPRPVLRGVLGGVNQLRGVGR